MIESNRLPYSTTAGNLSSEDTFKQLIEYLRLTVEDAKTLSDLRRQAKDETTALMWNVIAKNFHRTERNVINLAKGKLGSSVGYTGIAK